MKILSLLLALCFVFGVPQIGMSAPRASIVATINSEMITALQLEKNVKLAVLAKGKDPKKIAPNERQDIEKTVLQDLIKESILVQEAKNQKISVSDKDIDAEINASVQRAGITKEAFYKDLAKQGYDEAFYREKIKNTLLTQRLINRNVLRKIIVSNEEVIKYYLANGGKILGKANVALIVYPDSETMDKYAEELIKDSDDFEKIAKKISVGPYAEDGGVFGELAVSDLAEPIQAAIQNLNKDEVSKVFSLNGSYAQAKVLSKSNSSDNPAEVMDPQLVAKIQDGLRMQKAGSKIEEYIAGLEKKAIVNIK